MVVTFHWTHGYCHVLWSNKRFCRTILCIGKLFREVRLRPHSHSLGAAPLWTQLFISACLKLLGMLPELGYKILTLYSSAGSSTGTSLHTIFASAQAFYPWSIPCQHGSRVVTVKGGIKHVSLNETQNHASASAPSLNIRSKVIYFVRQSSNQHLFACLTGLT